MEEETQPSVAAHPDGDTCGRAVQMQESCVQRELARDPTSVAQIDDETPLVIIIIVARPRQHQEREVLALPFLHHAMHAPTFRSIGNRHSTGLPLDDL